MNHASTALAVREGDPGSGLRVVLVDDDLVVVDKPSGMPSVPARTPLDPPDVARVLGGRYGSLEAVHRLDRDTSGILVLARSREARTALGRAFESATVAKRYLAVVHAAMPASGGTLHLPLADDLAQPPRKRVDPILGRRAATRWRERARVAGDGLTGAGAVALVELEPMTGRSHQLRVHLAWLGCPILGDRLYGPRDGFAGPLALRAVSIAFPHPRSGRCVEVAVGMAVAAPWTLFGSESV